jgi:hypothetical protein
MVNPSACSTNNPQVSLTSPLLRQPISSPKVRQNNTLVRRQELDLQDLPTTYQKTRPALFPMDRSTDNPVGYLEACSWRTQITFPVLVRARQLP